jgi:hypothetical protein
MINEAALHPEFWTCANDSNYASGSTSLSVARTQMLSHSLASCKSFVEIFLSYRTQDLFYLTSFIYPRLCYVFITIAKLVYLDSDGKAGNESAQTGTRDVQKRTWNNMNVAKEANFQGLARLVLEKFAAVSTNFVGAEGQLDAMSNLASAMKILMAGYEQQMKEIQGDSQRSKTADKAVAVIQEDADADADSIMYPAVEEFGNSAGSGRFDIGFDWDSSATMIWDNMLENFTMMPFS